MYALFRPKKNIYLPMLLFSAGAAFFSSFITQLVLQAEELHILKPSNWFLDAVIAVLAILLFTVTYYGYRKFDARVAQVIHETVDTLVSGIVRFDTNGDLIQFNPSAARMIPELCFDAQDKGFIGDYKEFIAYVYDNSLDIQEKSNIAESFQENYSRLLFKEIILTKSRMVLLVQFYQRRDKEIIGVLTDISLLKQHMDKTTHQIEQNELIIKAIEARGKAILISQLDDVNNKIIYSNDVFSNICQMSPSEILNQKLVGLMERVFPLQAETIQKAVVVAKASGKSENTWLSPSSDFSEKEKWYSLSVFYFEDAHGRQYMVCLLSNQTQLRLEEARAFQKQKLDAVARLAGGIAHDFNNALAVIDGYTKLSVRGLERGDNVSGHFAKIQEGVKRGTEITNRLLTFGLCRMTEKTRIDICEQVREMEPLLHPMLNHNTRLVLSIQDNAAYVDMSPDSIAQILLSLVSNASEAMEEEGDLFVSVAEADMSRFPYLTRVINPADKFICLQVIDSGTGMVDHVQKRIFEPFFTTRESSSHAGMGLSLVYGIVENAGGFIDVKSRAGVGTTITVFLPEQAPPSYRQSLKDYGDEDAEIEEIDIHGKTVLIVDNMQEVLEIQAELLQAAGYRVLMTGNGQEAINMAKNYFGSIDYFLIDVSMPDMSGIELKAELKEIRPDTKAVLISAYPQSRNDENVYGGLEEALILAKPLNIHDFKSAIEGEAGIDSWVSDVTRGKTSHAG